MTISKEQILNTAAKLFQTYGYNATTVQDITDNLGVTKASFYYYIKSKEDLLCQIFDRAMTTVEQKIEGVIKLNLPAKEMIEEFISTHIAAIIEESSIITVFFSEYTHLPPEFKSIIESRRRQYEEKIVQLLKNGITTGELVNIDILPIVYGILGMCNWIYQWYNPEGKLKPHELAKMYSDVILKGLLPR